jgi:hypothetical protein
MDEGRKRVVAIVAGILVAKHLKPQKTCSITVAARARKLWWQRPYSGRNKLCEKLITCLKSRKDELSCAFVGPKEEP